MEKKAKAQESNILTLVGVGIVSTAILITAGMSWMLYEYTVSLLTDNLRQRLLSIAITQASNISYEDLENLHVEKDWEKPEWKKIVTQLKRAKDSNPNIVFMYLFRKKEGSADTLEFIADAESINPYANTDADITNDIDANGDGKIEPDGPDFLQWPGQEYPSPPEEAFEAFNGPLTNRELYTDAYGEVLTGYAPIKDDKGSVVAVLATDIKAGDFFIVTGQTLYPFLLFIIFLILAIVVLAALLVKIWNRRIALVQELDRQKDELLGIVSHQLATPVASAKWYLEMMLDGDVGKMTKEQTEHVKSVAAICSNLSDLVGMILDVSRIQLGKIHIDKQKLNLDSLVKEIIEVVEPKAKEKNIHFNKKLPKLPEAILDRRYTRMVIENLLSNAVKYTPANGQVDFIVTLNNENIYIEIKDTGVGIPKQEQTKIFGKLFRASNVRNNENGTGFGLYVAKGATEAQGGEIRFESQEGKGTTFYVELPIK